MTFELPGLSKPLSEDELKEVRQIEPTTRMADVRLGTPYQVIRRLLATIEQRDRSLAIQDKQHILDLDVIDALEAEIDWWRESDDL